jgi:hypothetical protein
MIVNNFKILKSNIDRNLVIPINLKWDFLDREDSLNVYQESIITEIIGEPENYETARFSYNYPVRYVFNFKNTENTDWVNSYVDSGRFTENQVLNKTNAFLKSFFKIDFYDSQNTRRRKNFLTIILNKKNDTTNIELNNDQGIRQLSIPSFSLNPLTNPEGFYLYWFENPNILNLNKLYMTVKFFDGSNGTFTTFTTKKQTNSTTPNRLGSDYFNREVNFNYTNYTYMIQNVGSQVPLTTINWYEYINPPEV